jgi:hypothetical protein
MIADALFRTGLSRDQQAGYDAWRSALPKGLQNTEDYDLAGAYLDSVGMSGNGHFTDQFKRPNHITFSDQSQYSSPENHGGTWDEIFGTYTPGAANLRYRTSDDIARYIKEREPGTRYMPLDREELIRQLGAEFAAKHPMRNNP